MRHTCRIGKCWMCFDICSASDFILKVPKILFWSYRQSLRIQYCIIKEPASALGFDVPKIKTKFWHQKAACGTERFGPGVYDS